MTDAEKLEKLRERVKQLEKTIEETKELFYAGGSSEEIYTILTKENK